MIAVVGATGHVGGEIVAQLAAAGTKVRALTRRPAAWTGPDVEVSDLDLRGASSAFLMSTERPVPGGRPERLAHLVDEARAAGVEHLVLLSVLSGSDGDDVLGHWNAATEALVVDSGIPWTLLRPGRFFSNAAHWAWAVRAGAPVPVGFARRPAAGIDPADVAAVAVRAFSEPSSYVDRGIRLTGPEPLTPLDELRILGEVLGRPLAAVEVSEQDVRRGMLAGGEAPEVVDAIVARTLDGDEGSTPLPAVAELLGRPPRRFVDWARAHATEFG